MAAELSIDAVVNGQAVQATVPANRVLSEFLRDDLGLTGTKVSCALELCGTCTVLLDGAAVSACTLLAAEIDGGEVLTVEGLAGADGALGPLQRAFVEHGAFQCGFCTPGMLMTATALLARDPDPDEETIREELHGNICRCTGYVPIVAAIRAAARELRT
ncbi:MAG TPA: (2Fe-2S)-binding protein [Gaiellaceae bacterium]|nr:(2Fe-2S)-binding protein [Gaiellaceae bacterium]